MKQKKNLDLQFSIQMRKNDGECKGRMGNINFPKGIKQYRNYIWRINECKHMKGYCNWCYYYVFEYN